MKLTNKLICMHCERGLSWSTEVSCYAGPKGSGISSLSYGIDPIPSFCPLDKLADEDYNLLIIERALFNEPI